MIKVCLNGGRSRAEHPAVPYTSDELVAEAVGAVAAGAFAVHAHPRSESGVESLAAADIGPAVSALRQVGVPVGVSTGLWITGGDLDERLARVRRWGDLPVAARPDFASVNVGEPGFDALVGVLRAAGIGVEPGVWSVADAERIRGTSGWVRVLVEIIGGPADTALARADEILAVLDVRPLLHGEEAACWPLVAHAHALGLDTRIGLEDTTVGPAGEAVTGNADLVRLALLHHE
jgi:uncharacterized protein (DUF849 family)